MELRHLRHFIAVAERLSFSKAAQALHITQPALSRQIKELEDELGCQLFVRKPTEITLTPEGLRLLERAVLLLRDAEDLKRELQTRGKAQRHRIRLAHFGTFIELYLVPFTQRVHTRHPQWNFDLLERDPADALPLLQRGEIDAAVLGRPAAEKLRGLSTKVIWSETPVIVVASNHKLAKRRRLTLGELAGEKLIVWDERQFPGFGAPFIAACRQAGFEPDVAQTVDSVAAVFSHAARDGMVGYVGQLASRLPTPGIAFKPLATGELDMPTLLVWRPESAGSEIVAELAELMAQAPSAGPAQLSGRDSMKTALPRVAAKSSALSGA